MYVFDRNTLDELGKVLWMGNLWLIYGIDLSSRECEPYPEAIPFCFDTISFIVDLLIKNRDDIDQLRKIGRHIKICYAASLAMHDTKRASKAE